MSIPPQPKGLEAWIDILDGSLLPVIPATARVLGQLIKDGDASLHDVGTLIAQDPVMTVHLIREVNRAFAKKAAGALTNVHHCVSLLGLDRVKLLVKQFKAIKGDPNSQRDMTYLRAIMQSLHAAEQAKAWNALRHQASPEHVYLSTLMAGVPMWCLWRFAHKEMAIINTLQKRERIPSEEAELAVLGCTREQIILALAKRWCFPSNIIDAMDSEKLPSHRYLAHAAKEGLTAIKPSLPNKDETVRIAKSPSFPVALANWLVQEASIDWYSRQTYRCLAIIGAYLGVQQDVAWRVIRGAALQTSQQFPIPGVLTPAVSLIFPPMPAQRRRIRTDKLAEVVGKMKEGASVTAVTRTASRSGVNNRKAPARKSMMAAPLVPSTAKSPGFKNEMKRRVFESYVKRLVNEVGYFSAEHEVIRCTADVLFDVTELQRVVIGLVDRKTLTLQGYYAIGCEDSPRLGKFTAGLEPPNFFTQVLRKPQAVWVSSDRANEITGLVPGEFKQLAQSDDYIVMSVFNGKGAFGILYADKAASGNQSINEMELKVCRSIANASSKHLILMAKKSKKV
jgi:HD-like signal output (HDOD) protein